MTKTEFVPTGTKKEIGQNVRKAYHFSDISQQQYTNKWVEKKNHKHHARVVIFGPNCPFVEGS